MTSTELRKKFLTFFEKRGHKIVPSSSLIPTDPSVLFASAGMQQFKPYYLGEKSPYGLNVATVQKCFRTSDIEEVGDESHLTFLEMLGNFSFGGYFKEEAISAAYELLNSKFKIQNSKMTVTVFGGDKEVPRDNESVKVWANFGFSEKKGNLHFAGREDNFWGPTGDEGPCGPTTEVYLNGIEVWNLVFNEYYQNKSGKLTFLEQKGVDTGMGLERLAMIVQGKNSVYETDLFEPIRDRGGTGEGQSLIGARRIVADHIKGAVFLISEGILPSNVERGYVLRRILRRAIRYGKLLGVAEQFLISLAQKTIEIYKDVYPELKPKETDILTVIQKEEEKFEKTLEEGLKQFERGLDAFELYATYGFPLELTIEMAKEKGRSVNVEEFNRKFKKHQELSRTSSAGMFKGGLADTGEKTIKYHTATHLLLAVLKQVLGPHVYQKGSNINAERLRFDFSHPQKMTEQELNKVEDIVNQKIKEDLPVACQETTLKEAKEMGATGVFGEKYGEKVKVYSIGEFSKEICGGPHVKRTSELGEFKILKEESSSAGIRRIKGILK